MTLAEKIKTARKEAGLSQEQLAEKLNVSRQAVTKWETDRGTPDIDNLAALSRLFGISIDQFISEDRTEVSLCGHIYESVTEYDIDALKHFDIDIDIARSVEVRGYDGEKVKVCLGSDTISTITRCFKVKIDDIKNRIDINVKRQQTISESEAIGNLDVCIFIPDEYNDHTEIKGICDSAVFAGINCEHVEFGGRVNKVDISGFNGRFELDCNNDMDVSASFTGSLEINQLSSVSRVTLPEGADFRTIVKGIKTKVRYEKNGEQTDDFSCESSENILEFNGVKSELTITRG